MPFMELLTLPLTVVTTKRLHKDRSLSIDQICKTLGISRPTFYRYLSLG